MHILYLITARGGSKGIPGKNTKLLNGIPLIQYTVNEARKLSSDELICVSTDSDEIIEVVEKSGLRVPFKRPAELATDTAGSDAVILHALSYYESKKIPVDVVVLLQPTSPFRRATHIEEALKLYTGKEDMILGVKETKANPYYILMEEDELFFLKKSKQLPNNAVRRQDAPKVYEVNGAIYVINAASMRTKQSLSKFERVKKYLMTEEDSLDIDTPLDWKLAEVILSEKGSK
jgi:CMP-N,N'-diacetyllegionaminic acid synthase